MGEKNISLVQRVYDDGIRGDLILVCRRLGIRLVRRLGSFVLAGVLARSVANLFPL